MIASPTSRRPNPRRCALAPEAKLALGYFDHLRRLLRFPDTHQQNAAEIVKEVEKTGTPEGLLLTKERLLAGSTDAADYMALARTAARAQNWQDVSLNIEKARGSTTNMLYQAGKLFDGYSPPAEVTQAKTTRSQGPQGPQGFDSCSLT